MRTTAMLRIPYGLTDFRDLRSDDYLYVDRTSHIRDVEDFGQVCLLIRPRRFGKSLWLSTLGCYYDLRRADEFERLFGDLAVGRDPTPLRNRYFVLEWDFSVVDARGTVDQIAARLWEHANSRMRTFVKRYRDHLPGDIELVENPATTLESLLAVLEETPYKLYLLIDEYDNFINEVMTTDVGTYRELAHRDGPYKALFKAVKAARARGLDRIFITGVSPVALNDLSSGFNIAVDLSSEPELATLHGFTEREVRELLQRIADDRGLDAGAVEDNLATMRTWYDGYRFGSDAPEPVYNPTNTLYYLRHLQRRGVPPEQLHDRNLSVDPGKLSFLGRSAAGAQVLGDLTQGDGTIALSELETSFSMDDLARRLQTDRRFVASFLYYLGLVTQIGRPPSTALGIPNLVVRKLLLDRLLSTYLAGDDVSESQEVVLAFFEHGELAPLLAFVESKLLPVLSNRDRPRTTPGRWQPELAVKSLFLSLLFNDRRYVAVSELEVGHGYADLCLLRRQRLRGTSAFDILFEFKYVTGKELGKTGSELRRIDVQALRASAKVRDALDAAHEQLLRYRGSLVARHGDDLELRSYAVVAVGFDRLLGDEVPSHGEPSPQAEAR